MKKEILAIAVLLLFALCGYGQVSWNVKAGMNVSKVTNYSAMDSDSDMKPGYQFGVGLDYYFTNHWGIQPLLMIVSKGYKTQGDYYFHIGDPLTEPLYGWSNKQTQDRIYLEMPVMLAYRINVSNSLKLVINGGGYVSYGIVGKHNVTNTSPEGSKDKWFFNIFELQPHWGEIKKIDYGLGAGTALEFKNRYSVSLFGEWGLTSADTNVSSWSRKNANHTYGLNIGYKF